MMSLILLLFAFSVPNIFQNLGLMLFSTLFTVIAVEIGLRILDYTPGQFGYNRWVHPVDSLIVFEGFTTDSTGILTVDTKLVAKMKARPNRHVSASEHLSEERRYPHEVYSVLMGHGLDTDYSKPLNEFWVRFNKLKFDERQAWDRKYAEYASDPINKEGFYSIPFVAKADSKPSILLLGDSFTWGHSASDCTNSFANILFSRGLWVYNTGISGADVSQYKAILKKYGPLIRPDVVVCNFFMGNDVQYFERKLSEKVPLNYHTNAGVIYSNHFGVSFPTANEAYENIMKNMIIPQNTLINKIFSTTVFSTLCWEYLVNLGLIDHHFFIGEKFPQSPITAVQSEEMQRFCDSIGAKFVMSVIPEFKNGKLNGAELIPNLFGEVPYYQHNSEVWMYDREDGHFNDEGHLAYADYLEQILVKELATLNLDYQVMDSLQ
ncbi:MAG: SGNH/GDSL hydrolase family protein [Flavobacteriales bacterium]|nr:SGNH/GDSL hydrolase family protein [Flavobacteriales bacterium]